MKKTISAISGLFSLALARMAQAGPNLSDAFGPTLNKAAGNSYNTTTTFTGTLSGVIYIILSLIGTLFILLLIYGGVNWMMAGGNEQNVERGKETIKEAIIGLIVVIGAYAMTYFFVKIFGTN